MTGMRKFCHEELKLLPGGSLVQAGLLDLDQNQITQSALLVLIAAPRLNRIGFNIKVPVELPSPLNHHLYELVEASRGAGAYSYYLALLRILASFCGALEQDQSRVDKEG